jgi:ankyrin repeat protein
MVIKFYKNNSNWQEIFTGVKAVRAENNYLILDYADIINGKHRFNLNDIHDISINDQLIRVDKISNR